MVERRQGAAVPDERSVADGDTTGILEPAGEVDDASNINAGPLRWATAISPRPILLITGDQAQSAWFSEKIHNAAAEPKELLVVPGARHIDFYDRTDLIPFDQLETFFADTLH